MKPLKELRKLDLDLSSGELYFSRVKDLHKRNIDLDVYLPTKKMNLQRGYVWTLDQKRELIMSVFLERYIPPVAFMSIIVEKDNVMDDDLWQIIDGKQRLSTFMSFIKGEFTVELEGNEYDINTLPEDYRNAILGYEIKGQRAFESHSQRFTDQDKINWFQRINFFGTVQGKEHFNLLVK